MSKEKVEDLINEANSIDLDERLKALGKARLANHKPTYLTIDDVLSSELSEKLIALVNERGAHSKWNDNPNCLEYQVGNPFSGAKLQCDKKVKDVFPELFAISEIILRQINRNFKNSSFQSITGHHGFWILKYEEGGEFSPHCDISHDEGGIQPPVLATASILLNDAFEGGDVVLGDSRGTPFKLERKVRSAAIWDGTTNHAVLPVTKGFRYVLIIHYVGEEK